MQKSRGRAGGSPSTSPKIPQPDSRRLLLAIVAIAVMVSAAGSDDSPESYRTTLPADADSRLEAAHSYRPGGSRGKASTEVFMINLGFKWTEYPVLKNRLKDAYDVAIDRLKAVPECRQIFTQLGEDGLRALTTTVYVRAIPRMEATWCRHAWSGTQVGGRAVFLCRRFTKLPLEKAATVLLHEALHSAGLSEKPHDPLGMTPEEINEMVRVSCDLRQRRAPPRFRDAEGPKLPQGLSVRGRQRVEEWTHDDPEALRVSGAGGAEASPTAADAMLVNSPVPVMIEPK